MNIFKRIFKRNAKPGFSLIELIVVIAILAVLAAVLVPSLYGNMEDSRATKDEHAMNELVSSVVQASASTDGYDELAQNASSKQVSCYIDQNSEANYTRQIFRNNADGTFFYDFNDDTRILNETAYYAAGRMYGVTITFEPQQRGKDFIYDIKSAKINKYVDDKGRTLADCPYVCTKICQTVGETILIDSNAYKHSEYTVFVRLGVADALNDFVPDSLKAYGQYNGTNMSTYMSSSLAAGRDNTISNPENLNPPATNPELGGGNDGGNHIAPVLKGNIVPVDGTYYVGVQSNKLGDYTGYTDKYTSGDVLPKPKDGDVFVLGDYEYRYNMAYEALSFSEWKTKQEIEILAAQRSGESNVLYMTAGWGVRVLENKSEYTEMLSSVNGKPVTMIVYTFSQTKLVHAPKISENTVNMYSAFYRATQLQTAPDLTRCPSVTCMRSTFSGCSNLKDGSSIYIPRTVYNMHCTFSHSGLTSAPAIPASVTEMIETFKSCGQLSGLVTINARNLKKYSGIFENTTLAISLSGSSNRISTIANTYDNVVLASQQAGE